jgi:hypothetical protein
MESKPRFRRLLRTTVVIALLVVVYVGSFVLLRKTSSVTFLPSGRFYTVWMHYFSPDPRINRFCYWLYLPLHWQRESDWLAFEGALFEPERDEELMRRRIKHVYVRDTEACRRAGLAGFRAQ